MAKYPDIEVGDIWTADLANASIPDIYYKSTSTTRASTTTLADDPDLVVPVAANGIYIVEFDLRYACLNNNTNTLAGFKTVWTAPTGTLSTNREVLGYGSNVVTDDNQLMRSGVHAYSTVVSYGSRNSTTLQVRAYEIGLVQLGSTAGNITLQWAQNTSNATGTVLAATSFAKATRIG